MKTTAEIAGEYREHCCALGTDKSWFDSPRLFDLDHLCLWLGKTVTNEGPFWSPASPPEFIRVSKRVLAWYRRHGWIRGVARYLYEWTENAP